MASLIGILKATERDTTIVKRFDLNENCLHYQIIKKLPYNLYFKEHVVTNLH